MKKLTRIEDVGDFLFGVKDDNIFWVAKFINSTGDVKWHRCDKTGKLSKQDVGWKSWSTYLHSMLEYMICPLTEREEGLSDVAYKIRILEQKFLNRKQHAVVNNSW